MAAVRERPRPAGMGGIRLGRLAGIDIRVHWSWFLIFFLLTWSLSEGLFRRDYPHWTAAQGWLAGAATSLVLFGSILVHELSHSLMARRKGVPVSSITLFIFGGVSALDKEPESPRQEVLIAGVGPATSFLLAGLFALAGLALSGTGTGTAAFYLAFINVLLGAFNLLPGFPLDGGRLLRALVWARQGSLVKATRTASLAGRVLAFALMAGGVLGILLGNFITGIWFIVIGWFLGSQAEVAFRQVAVRDVLGGAPASAVVNRDFHAVRPGLSLTDFLSDYVLTYHQRCYPVMSDGRLLGLVSLVDLRQFPREEWHERSVSEVMTARDELQMVEASDDLAKAAELMAAADVHQLPVMEDGALLGFVTRSDVVGWIRVHQELGQAAHEGSPGEGQRPREQARTR